jgi:hypothetical protein
MENPKNFKECKKCLTTYSIDKFDKKKAVCKSCNKDLYLQNKQLVSIDKIKERIPIRNEIIKMSMEQVGDNFDINTFNKYFVKFEKYEEMKKNPNDYSFCECTHIRQTDREHHKEQYEKKYFLDAVMCCNNLTGSAYIIHII